MRTAGRPRGFSIVELLIAIGVLVLGVFFVYDRFVETSRPSQRTLLKARARWLAAGRVEELRACTAEALKAWKPEAAFKPLEAAPQFRQKTEIASRPDGAVEISVTLGWEPTSADGQTFSSGQTMTIKGLRNP